MKIPNILNVFRKASSVAGVAISGFGGKVWPKRNYYTFAKDSYMKNVISFRCIDYIAKSIMTVPWEHYKIRGDNPEIVLNTPYNRLLKRANPEMSFCFLNYQTISYLVMAGNSYIERITPNGGPNVKVPRELWPIRNDLITVEVDKAGTKTAYVYSINGAEKKRWPIDIVTGQCDLLHIKLFHPLDDVYGMGITEPTAREIDTSNSSIEWNKNLLDNMGRPGFMLFYEKNLTDKQYDRISKDLREAREGMENAGKSIIIEGGKDAKPYGFSPAEMDWIKSNLEIARRICIGYGVPPQLIGIPDANTYSNYREARTAFWEETAIFYLDLLMGEYNNWLFDDENTYISYNLDDVPAFQYKRDLMWERAQNSEFITINEKREMIGYDPVDGGDVILQPASMLPLGFEPETDEQIGDEEDETVEKLMEQGYTREAAEELIGIVEDTDDKH